MNQTLIRLIPSLRETGKPVKLSGLFLPVCAPRAFLEGAKVGLMPWDDDEDSK
jgi:hypothetical protein